MATTAMAARHLRQAAVPAWAQPQLHTTMTSASERQPPPLPFVYYNALCSYLQRTYSCHLKVLGCILAPGLHAA